MIRTLNSLKFYFSSKPLPSGLYYPVMDVRTHDTHIYHDKIKSFSNHLQLKENIVDGKVQKYKENTIHQGQFKQFLLGQIKDDFSLLTKSKEIIFAGRSNAGKSSLINSLLGKKKLALVSKKTGSTQKLRFYELDKNWGYLVDSPGYGYSYINVLAQQKNQGMLLDYLKISTRCIRLYLLIRADDGIQINDMAFLYRTQPYKINTQIVLTKCDKLKEEQLNDRILSIGLQLRRFKHVNPIIHATSTTENLGIQELKCSIIDSLLFHKQRNIPDEYEESVLQYLEKHYRLKAGHLDKKTLEYYTKIKPMKQLMAQEQRKQLAGAQNKSIKILKK